MTPKILVTLPVSRSRLEAARERFCPYEIYHQVCQSPAEVDRLLNESIEVLFTNVVPPSIERCPNLKWVQLISAGIDHIRNTEIFKNPGIILTTGRGLYSVAISEYTIGVMVCLARSFPKALRFQLDRKWTPNEERYSEFLGFELHGKRAGIIGYGSVGQQIARLCLAFGMSVRALRRARPDPGEKRYVVPELRNLPEPAIDPPMIFPDGLDLLLTTSDFVIVAAPLTSETRGLIGMAAFKKMKRTAWMISISRGGIVDETALHRALQMNLIAGAALDVFSEEPVPRENVLYACPSLMMTPHIAGVFSCMFDRGFTLFMENFECYRTGTPLYNMVSRLRGY